LMKHPALPIELQDFLENPGGTRTHIPVNPNVVPSAFATFYAGQGDKNRETLWTLKGDILTPASLRRCPFKWWM